MRTTARDCRQRGGAYVLRGDRDSALDAWLPLANQGDKVAQTYVGEIYERGLGVKPDYTRAVEWYRKAAEQGSTRAQNNLGFLYEKGLGVPKDPNTALTWYRQAAGLTETITVEPDTASELHRLREDVERRTRQLEESQRQLEETQQELDRLKEQTAGTQETAELERLKAVLKQREAKFEQQQQKLARLEKEAKEHRKRFTHKENQVAFARLTSDFFGNYYAVIIGNSEYPHPLNRLESPLRDVQRLDQILRTKYGFKTTVLTNATREKIIDTLSQIQNNLKKGDNLLIYYAGHGKLNVSGRGFWLPVDAKQDSPANWVSNTDITDLLEIMKATHVLVVADSCYSGALTRGGPEELDPGISEQERITWLKTRAGKRSRKALTSGGLEPVLDSGGGAHSVFAQAFLDALENNDQIVAADRIYQDIAPEVRSNARKQSMEQTPEYGRITAAGDEYGEFFFVPASRGLVSYAYSRSR